MEEEKFFTGYCRQIDQNRMAAAVKEDGQLVEADCEYETCLYRKNCTLGRAITQWLEGAEQEP